MLCFILTTYERAPVRDVETGALWTTSNVPAGKSMQLAEGQVIELPKWRTSRSSICSLIIYVELRMSIKIEKQ